MVKKKYIRKNYITCSRCGRIKIHHAHGLCSGCYMSIHRIEQIKKHNAEVYHNIPYDLYKKITEKCLICGFNSIVELHHMDENHSNISGDNLVGLCPNHHAMIHHRDFRDEILKKLIAQDSTKKSETDFSYI